MDQGYDPALPALFDAAQHGQAAAHDPSLSEKRDHGEKQKGYPQYRGQVYFQKKHLRFDIGTQPFVTGLELF
jgi:hypothetical protein